MAALRDVRHARPVSTPSWNALLLDQTDWHWVNHLRPRLAGMTDAEYLWEPVPGAWSVRPRGTGSAPIRVGGGARTIDFAVPEPVPAPFTTIAWRIGHVLVGVLGERNANHFGRDPVSYESFHYAATATEALAQLEAEYATWRDGVLALGEKGLSGPCGPAEGPFAEAPMAALVLHINREVIHHLAEVCLLRDLYLHAGGRTLAG